MDGAHLSRVKIICVSAELQPGSENVGLYLEKNGKIAEKSRCGSGLGKQETSRVGGDRVPADSAVCREMPIFVCTISILAVF